MKLSKSKLALAKVINENGGWVDGTMQLATSNKNGSVYLWGNTPRRISHVWDFGGRFTALRGDWRKLPNWHQTILSREEYYQAYPKADADGWIEWNGGECPVDVELYVYVNYRDGCELPRAVRAGSQRWNHFGLGGDIVSYRLHKPEVKPEFCESVMRSIPEPGSESIDELCAKVTEENKHQHVDAKPTIEQLAQDYRNAKGYADRKQDEADKASMESDAALSQLEDAIAAIGFVITPLAATVKEPELVAAVKVGDQVGCVESNIKRDKYNGMVGRLHFIDENDTYTPYLVDFGGKAKIWCHEVKFIRRP